MPVPTHPATALLLLAALNVLDDALEILDDLYDLPEVGPAVPPLQARRDRIIAALHNHSRLASTVPQHSPDALYTALLSLAGVATASDLSNAIANIETYGAGLPADREAIEALQYTLNLCHADPS